MKLQNLSSYIIDIVMALETTINAQVRLTSFVHRYNSNNNAGVLLKLKTRCVCETQMSLVAAKSKMAFYNINVKLKVS